MPNSEYDFYSGCYRSCQRHADRVEILKERFSEKDEFTKQGTVVIGTIEGRYPRFRKEHCCFNLEGSGYKVCDLGVNVSPVQFVQTVINA